MWLKSVSRRGFRRVVSRFVVRVVEGWCCGWRGERKLEGYDAPSSSDACNLSRVLSSLPPWKNTKLRVSFSHPIRANSSYFPTLRATRIELIHTKQGWIDGHFGPHVLFLALLIFQGPAKRTAVHTNGISKSPRPWWWRLSHHFCSGVLWTSIRNIYLLPQHLLNYEADKWKESEEVCYHRLRLPLYILQLLKS